MTGLYQEQVKRENQSRIIRILQQESLTFTDLIKKTGLSRAVVNNHLKELIAAGQVRKCYVDGKILNILQSGAISKAFLFAGYSFPYILGGLEFDSLEQVEGAHKPESFRSEMRFEKNDLKERIASIGKRFGVFYLFSVLKAIEEKNDTWIEEAKNVFGVHFLMFPALGIRPYGTATMVLRPSEDLMVIHSPEKLGFDKKEIEIFRNNLENAFPEETKEFEAILKKGKSSAHDKDQQYSAH